MFEKLGDLRNTNTTLGSLSKIMGESGDQQSPRNMWRKPWKAQKKEASKTRRFASLNELASYTTFQGQLDEAQATAEQAMALARELQAPALQADLLNELGVIAWSKGGPPGTDHCGSLP